MAYDSHNPSSITWLDDKGVCYKYSNLKIKFRTDGEIASARQISTKEETSESIQYVFTGYYTHLAAIMKTILHICILVYILKWCFQGGSHRCIFLVRSNFVKQLESHKSLLSCNYCFSAATIILNDLLNIYLVICHVSCGKCVISNNMACCISF